MLESSKKYVIEMTIHTAEEFEEQRANDAFVTKIMNIAKWPSNCVVDDRGHLVKYENNRVISLGEANELQLAADMIISELMHPSQNR